MGRLFVAALRRVGHIARMVWARRAEWQGKTIGGVLGLTAGWFGLIFGLIIGYLTDELIKQGRADRALVRYLESPGPIDFKEPSPGVAAFCALATLVAAPVPSRRALNASFVSEGIGIADRIARSTAESFGLGRSTLPALESFVRVASLRLGRLNPDLLAESFAARRKEFRDAAALASSLAEFAAGVGGAELVGRIRSCVGPSPAGHKEDPWTVLGLEADATVKNVKAAYRRLAVDCHPDSIGAGDDAEKIKAAEAFMRIEAAYREIMRAKGLRP